MMKNIFLLNVFVVVLLVGFESAVPGVTGPLHASCKVNWLWPSTDCDLVHKKILNQIDLWKTDENCKNGGEKCLYKLVSDSANQIKATHTTPVKKYVDDLTFTFKPSNGTCQVEGFSTSETWYAVLDYGTNYCNLNNLITGAELDKVKGYTEITSDDICTQYSSANCEIY